MQLLTNTFLALFPLYFYMATGAVLKKMKILKTEDLPKMNALLFRSFLFFSLSMRYSLPLISIRLPGAERLIAATKLPLYP